MVAVTNSRFLMLQYLLVIFLILLDCSDIFASNNNLCVPYSSEFKFDSNSPPVNQPDLTFCKEYSRYTCCKPSHTQFITKSIYPYFTPDSEYPYSESCKQLTVSIYCSPCSSEIGTRQKIGLCRSTCENWFTQCSSSYYTQNEGNSYLQPCTSNSLVCSELKDIVNNGKQFCERMGFQVGISEQELLQDSNTQFDSRKSQVFKESLNSLLSNSDIDHAINYGVGTCFNPLESNTAPNMPNFKRAEDINKQKTTKSSYFSFSYWSNLVYRFIKNNRTAVTTGLIIGLFSISFYIKIKLRNNSNNNNIFTTKQKEKTIREIRAERLAAAAAASSSNVAIQK